MARAEAAFSAGRLGDAEKLCRAVLAKDERDAAALHLLGLIALRTGHPREAAQLIASAAEIEPDELRYLNSLTLAHVARSNVADAFAAVRRALALSPADPEALTNLGNLHATRGELDQAIGVFRRALAASPGHANAHLNLGSTLKMRGRLDEAIVHYRGAVEADPDQGHALAQLVHALLDACDWRDLDRLAARLDERTREALRRGHKPDETPLKNVTRCDNPAINLAVARAWSREVARGVARQKLRFSFDGWGAPRERITVAYLSGDFHDHPVGHVMAAILPRHDRGRFRVLAFSHGQDDGGACRARIASACDEFIDVSRSTHVEVARQIHERRIDILVDVKGRTSGSRHEIFALRPSPIQATFLAFPGSSGADFFDYMITDRIVSPPDEAAHYSEKLVHLPHSYLVADSGSGAKVGPPTRAAAGLPDGAFVYCSFNQPYKFEPILFELWMRLLRDTAGSVLWLSRVSAVATANLRQGAQRQGVDPSRLVFAPRVPGKAEHVARLALADLGLDTRVYSGHTSTVDALLAGVPVLALRGRHFASRGSASVLSAAGLPELIAGSLAEYEAMARRLAADRVELAGLRERLARNRASAPLFDPTRFARNLEGAYSEMWSLFAAGEAPRAIMVAEQG